MYFSFHFKKNFRLRCYFIAQTFIVGYFMVLGFPEKVMAQVQLFASTSPFFSVSDSQKLQLGVKQLSFFKNDEYFNDLNPGYTLIGTIVSPSLVYYPTPTIRIEGGYHFLKYDGRDGIYQSNPIFRFQYQPVNWLILNIGTLYGGEHHKLIEPLYQWERSITHPVEDGLQFLFNSYSFEADVWLEWQRFIQKEDPFQEVLLYGTSASFNHLAGDGAFNLSVPVQATIEHHGGQINLHDSLTPSMRTIANGGAGLKFVWTLSGVVLNYLSAECWALGFQDLSPSKEQAYQTGWAVYPKIEVKTEHFSSQMAYLLGNKFLTSEGEPLYLSAMIPYNGTNYPNKKVLSWKIAYNQNIAKGIFLGAYGEAYYNFAYSGLEYSYGVHLSFNRDFFLCHVR